MFIEDLGTLTWLGVIISNQPQPLPWAHGPPGRRWLLAESSGRVQSSSSSRPGAGAVLTWPPATARSGAESQGFPARGKRAVQRSGEAAAQVRALGKTAGLFRS